MNEYIIATVGELAGEVVSYSLVEFGSISPVQIRHRSSLLSIVPHPACQCPAFLEKLQIK